jgi:TPR repeat protein
MFSRQKILSAAVAACCFQPLLAISDEDLMAQAQAHQANGRYDLALNTYLLAADQGHSQAQRTAGLMLLYGQHVYGAEIQQDRTKGLWLIRKAAGNGCEVSKHLLEKLDAPKKG